METTAMPEMIDVLSFEASQLWDFMARLGYDGWSRLSACTGWTIGDVLAHLTQGASAWCATITRAPSPATLTRLPASRCSAMAGGSLAMRRERQRRLACTRLLTH